LSGNGDSIMGLPDDISALAQQLRLDTTLLYREILWALGGKEIMTA